MLHDLEETEEGFLFERLDGELALEGENARSTGDSAISALTLKDQIESDTDVPILRGSGLDWGYRQIANVVYVAVESLTETGEITLIDRQPASPQAGMVPVAIPGIPVDAGARRSLIFTYPTDSSPANHRSAASWIAPVSGTDYTAQTGLVVTGSVVGDSYRVTLQNSSAGSISVNDLRIRGTALAAGIPVIVEAKDSASITTFGEREYARPSPLFTSIGAAQEYADGRVSRQRSPHGWLVARWPAYSAAGQARSLDISRRITVERLGEVSDYHIEGISLAMRGFARMEYLLSPVPGVTVPSAPVVTVTAVSGQAAQLAVSWTAPFNGGSAITGYDVRYKRSTDSSWTSWTHTGTGRTTTITGLEQGGVSYDVQVLAKNAQGTSSWSASGTGRTPKQAPFTPSAPTVAGAVSQLVVSWTAPYNGGSAISGYDVRYKKSTDTVWIASPHTGTGRTTTITGLLSRDAYDVQVSATNAQGASSWSASGTGSATAVHTLYVVRSGLDWLYTVNTSTGSATRVGTQTVDLELDLEGLAGLELGALLP